MQRVVMSRDMKKIDEYTIEKFGIPSVVLMERAAYQTFLYIKNIFDRKTKFVVAAGTGNNGADGVALARILKLEGYECDVKIIGNVENCSDEFEKQMMSFNQLESCDIDKVIHYDDYDVIIDAIFGVGLSRNIKGDYYKEITSINESKNYGTKIVAIDIPSGVDGNTGNILNVAVDADYTVTFGCYKTGMLLYPGAKYCGKIDVENIGFAPNAYNQQNYNIFTLENSAINGLPKRPEYSNKGTFGKIVVFAGSKNMCGAAYLSGMAAYRSGAGIVKIVTVEENKQQLQTLIPEAIIETYDTDNFDESIINRACEYATSIVVGPGIGVSDCSIRIVSIVLEHNKPTVIDADALNIISENPELKIKFNENIVITPHLGEMSRLTKFKISEIKENLVNVAYDFAKEYNITVVLKDARTIVSDGINVYINKTGNSGMATGGSGDTLTGIIAAFLSAGHTMFQAAYQGVFVHGLSGDEAVDKTGEYSMMARDLLEQIQNIIEK